MARAHPHTHSRGLERALQDENAVSDLLQELTDLDPRPWKKLVGFVPTSSTREERLDTRTRADLVLSGSSSEHVAFVEVKLGHTLSNDQKERYEALAAAGHPLVMAALEADRVRLEDEAGASGRWSFVSLGELFSLWTRPQLGAEEALAPALALRVAGIVRHWEKQIARTFDERDALPFHEIELGFLRRAAARRMATALTQRGYVGYGTVNATGTQVIVEAYAPLNGDASRCLHAEVRFNPAGPTANLRFGVDFDTEETSETRRECYALARSLGEAMSVQALRSRLNERRPDLAGHLTGRRSGLRTPKGDWDAVLDHGYGTPVAPNRRAVYPEFSGDGTLRHQVSTTVSLSDLSAQGIMDLLGECLQSLHDAYDAIGG